MYCDSQAAVVSLNTGRCRETWTMHLSRCLFFYKGILPVGAPIRSPTGERQYTLPYRVAIFVHITKFHPGRRVGIPAARLDVGYPDTIVQQLFSAGLVESTKSTYTEQEVTGTNNCVARAEAYPATERTLSLFVASLYKDGLAGSTAKNVSRWRTLLTDHRSQWGWMTQIWEACHG